MEQSFSKVIDSLEQESSDTKVRTFFQLLTRLENPIEKATALAGYAKSRTKKNPVEGLRLAHCAFRLAPENTQVAEAVEQIFRYLGRSDAAQQMNAYLKGLRQEPQQGPTTEINLTPDASVQVMAPDLPFHEPSPITDEISFDEPMSDTPTPPPPPNEAGRLTFSSILGQIPEPEEKHYYSLSQLNKGIEASFRLTGLTATDEPQSPEPSQGVDSQSKETRAQTGLSLFERFIADAEIEFRLLEYTDEFANSLLGLVHFVHYLGYTGKINASDFTAVAMELERFLQQHPHNDKAKVRLVELVRPLLVS